MSIATKSGTFVGIVIARHRIKLLTLIVLILCVWFGIKYEAYAEITEHLSNVEVPETLKAPISKVSQVFHGHAHDTKHEIMSAEDAAQFCTWYRVEPLDREAAASRKIFDLMLVNTELDMLELRLGQMSHGVDHFIILESDMTFSGKEKPLYVQESWARFSKHHPKMIRKTMDLTTDEFNGAWGREEASRNAMYQQVIPYLEGDQAASPNDVILVSDIDELFKPVTLRILRNCAVPDTVTATSYMYYYGFQWRSIDIWQQPRAMLYHGADKQEVLPHQLRMQSTTEAIFSNGGWHCSYCFRTLKELITKITSFSHTEYDQPQYKDPAHTVFKVRNGWDMFERSNFTRVMGDLDLPEYVKANPKQFRHLIDRDPAGANFADWDTKTGTMIELAP